MMDYCQSVNVFQGNGEIDLPPAQGIAAKWFFIKAGCGNTSPAATLPFGPMSAAPYTGGYPTGSTNHKMNSFARPRHFDDDGLLGFSHLHQSGVGAVGYYYNYCLVSPHYGETIERQPILSETAQPGYYACELDGINCELTVDRRTALHRYTFRKTGGRIRIDFANMDLHYPDFESRNAEVRSLRIEGDLILSEVFAEGVSLFFAVQCKLPKTATETYVDLSVDEPDEVELKVAVSLASCEKALAYLQAAGGFDESKARAYDIWNKELSKIRIETDSDEVREIFYSNLYHSLVKPADWDGESFIYDKGKPFSVDFTTLWDMYKTQLSLLFLIDREQGEKAVETLLSCGEALGQLPNNIGLSARTKLHAEQARMLAEYVLLTAYRYGVKMDADRLLRCIETDIFADNKKDFTVDGVCQSHTWMLDMADGCGLTAQLARERGRDALAERLEPLAQQWKMCYSEETGLLKADSSYYEGTLYNYSFRQMLDMDERITLAGGKERFVELLDRFFGYGQPDVTLPTDPTDYEPVAEGIKLGRFEGFNNESDTEAPFSYIYADRHDRTCEIIRSGMKYMFTTGKGGLPGNNDTGALSSYYCCMALGLFPVAGRDLFLLGSPFVKRAEIDLFNGSRLIVETDVVSDEAIYVKAAAFNDEPIDGYRIKASELLRGGTLQFCMTDRPTK
ncbi:MAG: glycoside hydrolase family 92 protein [Clostridia bacterium]|nr:glycoside hydrolase family 92 protein [Clostridia bacterium]